MKRNVSVVCLIVVTRSISQPASQPVSCLTRLSADLSFGRGCLHNTVVFRECYCNVSVHTGELENVSVYCGGESVYCPHLLENRIDKVMSTAIPGEVWRQMVATSSTCYDIVTFLTQRTYCCSNFVAISSLVLELLKKCRFR